MSTSQFNFDPQELAVTMVEFPHLARKCIEQSKANPAATMPTGEFTYPHVAANLATQLAVFFSMNLFPEWAQIEQWFSDFEDQGFEALAANPDYMAGKDTQENE